MITGPDKIIRFLWCVLSGLVLLFLLGSCVNENEPEGPSLGVGDKLPSFSVELYDGTEITTKSFIGKVGIIVFFNTSCPDCREELPELQKLYECFENNQDILMVAIARDEDRESISRYWEENNLTIPWSPQEGKTIYNLFAQSIIPRIYLTDRSGIITTTYNDSDMPDFSEMKESVEKNLALYYGTHRYFQTEKGK